MRGWLFKPIAQGSPAHLHQQGRSFLGGLLLGLEEVGPELELLAVERPQQPIALELFT